MREENVKEVAPSSRQFFVNGMSGHNAVYSINQVNNSDVYLIERTYDRPAIKVLIADIYIAGMADIVELCRLYTDIDCIVLVGFYNRYSRDAKNHAKLCGVGLYTNSEFFGAVNCTGKALLNYVRKEQ